MSFVYLGVAYNKVVLSDKSKKFIKEKLFVSDMSVALSEIERKLDGITECTKTIPGKGVKRIDGKFRQIVGQTIQYEIEGGTGVCINMALVLKFKESGDVWVDEIRLLQND